MCHSVCRACAKGVVDRIACKVVMDRWQEMLLVNKMGSLGFCKHFAGCGGRSDGWERDLFSPKGSVAGHCGLEWAAARVLAQNP